MLWSVKFWCKYKSLNWKRVYSTRYTEHNTKIYIVIVDKKLNDKVLNLALDPKEHINLGFHITLNQ